MFNIFKRKKKLRFYCSELKPNERIEKILLDFIYPYLEPLGFKFIKSEFCFLRSNGDFDNVISFQKNKWNKANEVCAFKPLLTIYSSELPKYLGISKNEKRSWFLGDSVEYIEGWSNKYFDGYYDLAAYDNFDLIESFKNDLLNIGVTYFNSYTTYTDIINHYLHNEKKYYMAPHLFDLCQMKQNKESAVSILNWFEGFKNNTSKEISQETLKEIELREAKLKNWL